MTLSRWLYLKKWTFLTSPLWLAVTNRRLRSYLRDRYTGIRYAMPYWATPCWRRWLRDYGVPMLRRLHGKLFH